MKFYRGSLRRIEDPGATLIEFFVLFSIYSRLSQMAPEFVQECSDLSVLKNSTAQLEVIAAGSQPLQIRWFKDNEPIKYGKRLKMSSDGEHCSLKISPVVIQDQGIYKCVISNKAGTQSCEAKLTVEGWCQRVITTDQLL